MKKLINAIAQAVVERILSEEQVDQVVDRIVDLLIERLQNEFGDSLTSIFQRLIFPQSAFGRRLAAKMLASTTQPRRPRWPAMPKRIFNR